MTPEFLHFRCMWHLVEGHFQQSKHSFAAKCEVVGCKNRGLAFWYRGVEFASLPVPQVKDMLYDSAYGG